MSLPQVAVRRETVEIAGEKVEIRALTRAEAVRVKQLVEKDLAAGERFIIQCATDSAASEVEEWYKAVEAGVVDALIDAAVKLSGIGEGAQFRG